MLIVFCADVFTSFRHRNAMVCLENTDPTNRRKSKDFLLATINPSFTNFKYI